MELSQLLYAVTLAEYRNFSRASEALFITQPTLSQQIQKLERECGFAIFVRSSRQVTPTLEGELVLKQAQKVLADFGELQKVIKDINKASDESITVGIGMASRSYVAECASQVISRFPSITFQLVEAWGPELLTMLREGQVDIALLDIDHDPDKPKEYADLDIAPISEEYICTLMSYDHPLAERESLTLDELENENLLFSSMRSGLRKLLIRSFEYRGISPHLGMNFNSSETCLDFVERGTGVSFATHMRAERFRDRLAVIPVTPKIYRTYALVTKKTNRRSSNQVLRALRNAITEEIKNSTCTDHTEMI